MGLINESGQISTLEKDSEKFRYAQLFMQQCRDVVNGKIEFITNIRCKLKSVVFSVADTDTVIEHGLGFVPNGYFIVGLSAAMIIYDGSSPPSADSITLKSSAVGAAEIMFF